MLLALLKTMRPKQWTKNIFIFGALVFDLKLFQMPSLIRTLIGFILLCLVSGTVYIINDLVDREKDRAHPQKKYRPIASGELNQGLATACAFIFPLVLLPLSFWLNVGFGILMTFYLGLQLAYSFKLKQLVIIDVMTIAAGFVIRVGAGVVLIEVTRFSPWLYVCMTLLALFLGFSKRRQEIINLQEDTKKTRSILSDYSIPFLDTMIIIVTTNTIMAYALYTFSAPHLPDNHAMMLTIPIVMYAIFRYLYLMYIQHYGEDPSEILLQDRPFQVAIVLWGISAIVAVYWGSIARLLSR